MMSRHLHYIASAMGITATAILGALFIGTAHASPLPLHRRARSSSIHAGWNEWDCQPLAAENEHEPARRPVVLLHGLLANGDKNGVWGPMGRFLVEKGYCVYSFTYGANVALGDGALDLLLENDKKSAVQQEGDGRGGVAGGLDDIKRSAEEVAQFVDRVQKATGAPKVHLIGHSEGTVVARSYLKFSGGASKVDKVVLLAPLIHGTTLFGVASMLEGLGLAPLTEIATRMAGLRSLAQMRPGADFLKELNAGGESLPEVQYLTILTKYDGLITPPESGLLENSYGHIVQSLFNPSSSSSSDASSSASSSVASSFDAALVYPLNSSPSIAWMRSGREGMAYSNVFNQWMQDLCPNDQSNHFDLTNSPLVFASIYQFFNPTIQVNIFCSS